MALPGLELGTPNSSTAQSASAAFPPYPGSDRPTPGDAASHRPQGSITDAVREALYADFQPLVRRLIWQYGEDAESRSDLEGEIYYRFCQLVAAYDAGRGVPLKAYLAHNLPVSVYTYARKQWSNRRRENSMEIESLAGDRSDSSDPTRQWDDQLEMQAVLKELPDAIARLSLSQRRVVIWRYYEARSYEEIAAILNIQESTARALLRNGIKNLRRHLADVAGLRD
jgi:RNA polymerase sigma factor (sigma-70 family)